MLKIAPMNNNDLIEIARADRSNYKPLIQWADGLERLIADGYLARYADADEHTIEALDHLLDQAYADSDHE